MEQAKPTNYWGLWIARGLIYMVLGASLFWLTRASGASSAPIIGSLLIAAGICGCMYAFIILRTDRNYFWELLRSLFDIGFGIAVLVLSKGDIDRMFDVLAYWATTYAFINAVQAIYIFMLAGVNQPRNVFGNLLHLLSVVLAGGLAYVLIMVPEDVTVSIILIGSLVLLLGLITIVLAIIQHRTLITHGPI